VAGDLTKEGLALPTEHYESIIENVHIIMNCAASVDFNDPIKQAIQINYYGPVRMLEIAKRCRNLEVLTHVSTAYVNCNLKGRISEEIYHPEEDVAEVVSNIMAMSDDEAK